MENRILTLNQWVNEGYETNKNLLAHKQWKTQADALKKKRIAELALYLDRTDTTIFNYMAGRIIPSEDIRNDISQIAQTDILWIIEGTFIVNKYEHIE